MAAETVEKITGAVERKLEDVSGAASAARVRVGGALGDAQAQARDIIQEYPLASLAAAVLAGYVVARLLPRV
jgi:hypothetical protein